jgi:hypothetical protein
LPVNALSSMAGGVQASRAMTMWGRLPAFFWPNPMALMGQGWPLGSEYARYYSTGPLRKTLSELVTFDRINRRHTRILVGGGECVHQPDACGCPPGAELAG